MRGAARGADRGRGRDRRAPGAADAHARRRVGGAGSSTGAAPEFCAQPLPCVEPWTGRPNPPVPGHLEIGVGGRIKSLRLAPSVASAHHPGCRAEARQRCRHPFGASTPAVTADVRGSAEDHGPLVRASARTTDRWAWPATVRVEDPRSPLLGFVAARHRWSLPPGTGRRTAQVVRKILGAAPTDDLPTEDKSPRFGKRQSGDG